MPVYIDEEACIQERIIVCRILYFPLLYIIILTYVKKLHSFYLENMLSELLTGYKK